LSKLWDVPNWCTVSGINVAGNFCGQNDFAGKRGTLTRAGYLCTGDSFKSLSPMSLAKGINNMNDVVGYRIGDTSYLYLASKARTYSLDNLIDSRNAQADRDLWDARLPIAEQINDEGIIMGNVSQTTDQTVYQTFVLVPVQP
jgi:hypothetical protein